MAKTSIPAKGSAAQIEDTLTAIDGVREVKIVEGEVEVEYDDAVVDANKLKAALR